MKLLIISTPVSPIGEGKGGGVHVSLASITQALQQHAVEISIIAPKGSKTESLQNVHLIEVDGSLQESCQQFGRHSPIEFKTNTVLENMLASALELQPSYDVILNMSYDWLSFWLTPKFKTPLLHLVSLSSTNNMIDKVIQKISQDYPNHLAFHSLSSAQSHKLTNPAIIVANGFDMNSFHYQPEAQPHLGWVGRASPEKGLEDSIKAATISNTPLHLWAYIENKQYWQELNEKFFTTLITYRGFVSSQVLRSQLGYCQALLMTHKWVEAFGNIAIEAMACGVPVISYARGGPLETIKNDINGVLVEPDNIKALIEAIPRAKKINRKNCSDSVKLFYGLDAYAERLLNWFEQVM